MLFVLTNQLSTKTKNFVDFLRTLWKFCKKSYFLFFLKVYRVFFVYGQLTTFLFFLFCFFVITN